MLLLPYMVMDCNRRIPWLIGRHHDPKDHPVTGVCLPNRRCRISMHFAAENLPRPGIPCKPVGKSLRTIIITFFPVSSASTGSPLSSAAVWIKFPSASSRRIPFWINRTYSRKFSSPGAVITACSAKLSFFLVKLRYHSAPAGSTITAPNNP